MILILKNLIVVILDNSKQEKVDNALIRRLARKKKEQRNPIVWRGKYVNVSRTESGRLQPHFREISLADRLEGDILPYRVATELYKAQKDLGINLEEGSGLNFTPITC